MSEKNYVPYVKCGRVYQPNLPNELNPSESPIVLADVTVNTNYISTPCVFVKFSEFINITILGLNPRLYILYRLVRKDRYSKDAQILQEWEFEFESSEPIEIANVDTNQPTVLNYCDCLDQYASNNITYTIEIVQIETNNVKNYGITNKSISANVLRGEDQYCKRSYWQRIRNQKSFEPFIKCGKIFNPVLPLHLSKNEKPIILAQASFNIKGDCNVCILMNFSGFVTSVLKEGRFNNLTFRLVEKVDDSTKEILQEWPFRRAFVNDTNIKEPIVYDFCECINDKFDKCFTYTFELVEAELSNDSYYDISQKGMTAQVYCGTDNEHCIRKEH